MAHKDWCRKPCSECESSCALDESIPCGPDCDFINEDGTLYFSGCIGAKCDNTGSYAYCEGELKDPEDCKENCIRYKGCGRIELAEIMNELIHSLAS